MKLFVDGATKLKKKKKKKTWSKPYFPIACLMGQQSVSKQRHTTRPVDPALPAVQVQQVSVTTASTARRITRDGAIFPLSVTPQQAVP